MTVYVTAGDALAFNERFAGPDRLRDFGLLDAALMRPQASAFGGDAFPSLHEKAAALLHGLARNHPFVDGNKRTAWAAADAFYKRNGYEIEADQGAIVSLVVDAAEGVLDVPAIAAALKPWARRLDLPPLPYEPDAPLAD